MRGVKKENLPNKICLVCQKPFAWRKKWEKIWDEVKPDDKAALLQQADYYLKNINEL